MSTAAPTEIKIFWCPAGRENNLEKEINEYFRQDAFRTPTGIKYLPDDHGMTVVVEWNGPK